MARIISKIILLAAIAGLAVGIVVYLSKSPELNAALDEFAKCLAAKNITMYGAEWCQHCQNEKAAFGQSFQYVPYVECPQNIAKCLAAGINGYPTWVFPNGQKLEGEQGLKKLSQESGCPLP